MILALLWACSTCFHTPRWPIKTGADPQVAEVDLVPRRTTIPQLQTLSRPTDLFRATRFAPTELATFELVDVVLESARRTLDRDYHLVVADGDATLIAEIPQPKCCTQKSRWVRAIDRARSTFEAATPTITYGETRVTLIGAAFFDHYHGQEGASVNGIELHPVLSICVGEGCEPAPLAEVLE